MSKQPTEGQEQHRPDDKLPDWWHAISRRFDIAGRLAEHVEGRWQKWWVPAVLLSFPVLLLLLATAITLLRG